MRISFAMTEWIGARVDTVGGRKEGKKERRSDEGINAEDAEVAEKRNPGPTLCMRQRRKG